MSVSPISHSPQRAIAAGLQSQMQAQTMSQVLDAAGLLEPDMAAALVEIQKSAQAISVAGASLAKQDLLGSFIDAFA